jgi:hypothetical protein
VSDTIHVHIGTTEDMGQRFIEAWNRAEHEHPRRNPADISSLVTDIVSPGSETLADFAGRD